MITQDSIENIKDASIVQVISQFVKLQKKGANYLGCCPFHDEKTGSFTVSDSKGIYKCFGCGASGDSIKFVMEQEHKPFYEAVKKIGEICGIEITEEKQELSIKQTERISEAKNQEEVLNFIIPIYRKNLMELPDDHPAKLWLKERRISTRVINEWDLGWAGAEWQLITPILIKQGKLEAATKLGIIRKGKDGTNYDGYRSRITFAIKDKNGRKTGIAGRYIAMGADNFTPPKWINPADCELYNKSNTVYGLHAQKRNIKETAHAYVAEGYTDVISAVEIGMKNVIASSGTAFTEGQMQMLFKEGVRHVTTFFDNDNAGEAAFKKALPELLKLGFRVTRARYSEKDPDEYARAVSPLELNGEFYLPYPIEEDGIMFAAREIMEAAAEDPFKNASAKAQVLELLTSIKNEIVRNNYFDSIIKIYKWKGSDTRKQFTTIMETVAPDMAAEEGGAVALPDWLSDEQKDSFLECGYITVNRTHNGRPMVGYYSFTATGKNEITNFLINPLFHVYAGIESRFLLQIFNGYKNAVLDVPAKVIPSIDQMQGMAVSEGNFVIFGAKAQWLRIASDLLQNFPRCIELKSLGWQTFGFYAWVDKIFIPGLGLQELDNWGIIKHNEENFLVPASCEAYRMLQRTGEDPYENDRYLTFKQSSGTFSQWGELMMKVYQQKGNVAIAYTILSLFRDIVFEVDNNCPHLYGFGEPSSGKSKWAESITAVFYFKRNAFNLNSGTDFAYFNYMQRYINSPNHLNEFDIEVIKPEWFQAIKGIYDGEGRERGKGGSKNRTEVMRVNGTLILTGQKLITADDNSVVTRSLIEAFSTNDERTEEDKHNYDRLKDWEQKGMSSMLVELLPMREQFEENYKDLFNAQLSSWRKNKKQGNETNQRIVQNYAHLATCYNIVSRKMTLPQPAEEFTDYCYKQAVHWSSFIRSSDTLSEFWRTLEYLADQQYINEGWDYIIETVVDIKYKLSRAEEAERHFEEPTKVLYIRLNNIHKQFQQSYRTRTGKEAMNMENLLHYFTSRRYYVGAIKQKNFRRIITESEEVQNTGGYGGSHIETGKKEQQQKSSCYAFIYEDLNINIERHDGNNDTMGEEHAFSEKQENEKNALPF